MNRGRIAAAVLIVIVAAACSKGSSANLDEAAECKIEPGVVCTNQDLASVSMVAADLSGADFSGSDLSNADLRNADLTGAKLVGTKLGGADLTEANLTNADLTRAFLFFTNLSNANMTGAITTGMQSCNVTQPDGRLDRGYCTTDATLPTDPAKPASGPPTIDYFRLTSPARCLNDAAGPGINVEFATKNATATTFTVDGIRIEGESKLKGTLRLPFECDGKEHVVGMQAFGSIAPAAGSSFSVALQPGEPVSAEDG